MAGFQIQCTTTSASESVTLPLVTGYTYNCTVDWNDGAPVSVTAWDDANATHVYATPGTYTVEITGACPAWSVNNTHSSRLQWTGIVYWGDAVDFDGWQYLVGGWFGCLNLTSLGSGTIISDGLSSLHRCFQLTGIASVPVGFFDECSGVATAFAIFSTCSNLNATPDLLFAPFTSCTNFQYALYNCVQYAPNKNLFYADGDKDTRFLNQSVNFSYCFKTTSTYGYGPIPDLWTCDFGTGTPSHTDWIAGQSSSTLSNWDSIPSTWDGDTEAPNTSSVTISLSSIDGSVIIQDTPSVLSIAPSLSAIDGSAFLQDTPGGLSVVPLLSSVDGSVLIQDTPGIVNVVPSLSAIDSSLLIQDAPGVLNVIPLFSAIDGEAILGTSPTITEVTPGSIRNGLNAHVLGINFSAQGNTVLLGDNASYALANKIGQYINFESGTSIYFTVDNGGVFEETWYVFVQNESGLYNATGYPLYITQPEVPTVFQGTFVGHGHQPFGRHSFGGMVSPYEPRFYASNPPHGSTDVSVLFVAAKTEIYCFSSRVQDIHVEVSEDGGSFVDAYVNGVFVAPYNAPDSYVDFHQADPQKTILKVEKNIPWDENIEVVIRVTATDQFGNEATDELPITW